MNLGGFRTLVGGLRKQVVILVYGLLPTHKAVLNQVLLHFLVHELVVRFIHHHLIYFLIVLSTRLSHLWLALLGHILLPLAFWVHGSPM